MNIVLTYCLFATSLCMLQYHIETQQLSCSDYIKPLVYILSIIIHYIEWKKKYIVYHFLYIGVLLYYYLFKDSVVISYIVLSVTTCMYNIVRYELFFEYILLKTDAITKGEHTFPYYALMSNVANVAEKKGVQLLTSLNIKFALESAGILALLSLCNVVFLNTTFTKNPLFNDQIRIRRPLVQSSGLLLAYYISLSQAKLLNNELLLFNSVYDVFPLAVMFSIVFANKHMLKYLTHKTYIYIYPTLIFITSIVVLLSSVLSLKYSFLEKTLYLVSVCSMYILFDPVRFCLYITHIPQLIQMYVAYDTCALMFATFLAYLYANVYVNLICCILFAGIVHYSRKYYNKDYLCMECILHI